MYFNMIRWQKQSQKNYDGLAIVNIWSNEDNQIWYTYYTNLIELFTEYTWYIHTTKLIWNYPEFTQKELFSMSFW